MQGELTYEVSKPINSIGSQQLLKSNEITQSEIKKVICKCICKKYRQQPSREGLENSFTYLPGDISMLCFCDFGKNSYFSKCC